MRTTIFLLLFDHRSQVTHSLPVRARLNIFFNAVMQKNTAAKEFLTSVQNYQSVFTQLVMPDPKGQKTLLTVIERFFCVSVKFRPVVPVLLQVRKSLPIICIAPTLMLHLPLHHAPHVSQSACMCDSDILQR